MIQPIRSEEVREYLHSQSHCKPWKDWFLLPSETYLIRRTRVKHVLTEGVIHTPGCRYVKDATDTARYHWEEVNNAELIYYWWAMAMDENPTKSGNTPPQLTGFMRFCSSCTAVRPNHQKARELYERAHPRPD